MTMSDKMSIGLTPAAIQALDQICGTDSRAWFKEKDDAARFALALALNAGIREGRAEGADTRWAIGNFDPDHQIRSLISVLAPEAAPGRLIEHLVNYGLEMVGDALRQ